jgi:hypothetical protein
MMKLMTFVLSAALVVGLVGCGDLKEKKDGTSKGTDGATLTVTHSPETPKVKVGESTKVKFKVKREKFDGDVDFTFDTKDTGLKIKESDTKIPKGSDDREFTIEASDKATPGNQTIKYAAKGEKDTKVADQSFKVIVEK